MTNQADHDWQQCVVVENHRVADRVRRIVLERPAPSGRPAAPGSHVDVRLPADAPRSAGEVRSYSIVESDAEGRRLALSVRLAANGRGGSAYLHALPVGATLHATGPLQDFPLLVGADGYTVLAGGIGITAVLGMARTLRRLALPYRLVYAGRTRSAMPYLAELAAEHGDQLAIHVSDEGSALDVNALVADVATRPGRQELLMCGPVRLMDAVRRSWATARLDPVDLRFETFGNSGWFDAEPFEVTLADTGLTTTVKAEESILDALTAAGADLMWDCRRGECGLCVMHVDELDGVLDHRDVFLSDAQRASGDRVCLCVARAVRASGSGPARVVIGTA